MSISRIYQSVTCSIGEVLTLTEAASHHLFRVLRAKVNDCITLFNGKGGEYSCTISKIDKKFVSVKVETFNPREAESSLELYLAQGISRGEKMDFVIQKAVELGVKKIIPLLTERCNIKLDLDRSIKRQQHWQSIAISACEQSGRNWIPEVSAPSSFDKWLPSITADMCFVLSPHVNKDLSHYSFPNNARVVLLIGPEGGLSDKEIAQAAQKGFQSLRLGPRVLRTETAALAAVTVIQCLYGDMAGV